MRVAVRGKGMGSVRIRKKRHRSSADHCTCSFAYVRARPTLHATSKHTFQHSAPSLTTWGGPLLDDRSRTLFGGCSNQERSK